MKFRLGRLSRALEQEYPNDGNPELVSGERPRRFYNFVTFLTMFSSSKHSKRRDSLACSESGAAGFREKKIAQQEIRMGNFKRFSLRVCLHWRLY